MKHNPELPFNCAIVTGAAGFLGAALASRLARHSVKVLAVDIQPPRRPVTHGVSFIQADLLGESSLAKVVERANADHDMRECRVFHLAAESHVGRCRENPSRAFGINVSLTLQLLAACRDTGITHFIYPSSALLYQVPRPTLVAEDHPVAATSIYAATKLAAENLVSGYASEFGLTCGIARLGNLYGPDGHADSVAAILLRQARAGGPLVLRSLSPIRDFIYRDDVCDGLIAMACESAGGVQVVNLASGTGTSIRELAFTLCRVAGLPESVQETNPTSTTGTDHLVLSIDRAIERYAWRPKYTLEMGLRAALNEC